MPDGRELRHDVLEAYRLSAVKLHREGVSVPVLAKSFGVGRPAVYKWLQKFKQKGRKSLQATTGSGRPPILNESCFSALKNLLKKPATRLGYTTDLWSGPRVEHLIRKQFKIAYHAKHIPRLLRRLGLYLKFPERRALEQDPKELRLWKKERLPDILGWARKHKALVFYADESLISLIPYVGKTWTFPKLKPIARVSGRRGQHIGVTGAVTQQGRFLFELTQDKENFTARVFLRFVRKMGREYPSRNIALIVDGAPVHTAKRVKAFKEENKSWLRLEILPAYSPELNPSEKIWRFTKTKQLNGSTCRDKKELRKKSISALRSLKKDSKRITSFFVS
jgi:transposase